ncbi:MAG: formate dehydrogenase accessory sulfurtransferase FdhD [Anaerolineae bacterium]
MAVDKIAGLSLLRGIPTRRRFLLTTGRISTEMLSKAASTGVPLVASRNSPTHMAVRLAREWGMTVCGYVRGRRMHIYSAPERLGFVGDGEPIALSVSRSDAAGMWIPSERAMFAVR